MSHLFIYIAVFICGASVLALEILGTRLIGPVFGVSLYLWSALIGVTLAALSVGYAWGGRLADKPSLTGFSLPIGLAGLWTVAIPWLRYPILDITDGLGLRAAVLVSATILFFPPLLMLGMVSPFAIKLKTAKLDQVGRTAGNLYALSTVASVFAAIGTGFFLIPNIGVARLTYLIGILLVITAAVGIALDRKGKIAAIAAVILLIGGIAAYQVAPVAQAVPEAGLLHVTQSAYAEIRVLEKKDLRFMIIDGGTHTIVDPAEGWASDYGYIDVVEIAKKFYEKPGKVMVVGVGGGSVLKVFHRDGWEVEAVEIDPVVTQTAYDWFGLEPSEGKIHHTDGRQFFIQNEDTYDVVIMDAFGSSSVPFHLVTEEAFGLVHSRLNEGGILAMNIEAEGWHDIIVHSLAATLSGQFSHVKVLPIEEPPTTFGNVIIMASDRPLELDDYLFPVPSRRWTLEYNQTHAWDNAFTVAPAPDVPILTDDLNPVDIWSDRINLASRKQLHEYFGDDDLAW